MPGLMQFENQHRASALGLMDRIAAQENAREYNNQQIALQNKRTRASALGTLAGAGVALATGAGALFGPVAAGVSLLASLF